MEKRLYLIDGSSYIYRAFYAIRESLANSKDLPTNAVYGFALMLLKIFKTMSPEYLAIVFDMKGKTHRHEEFPEYKATRPKMPEELSVQIPYIHKLVEAFNIYSIQREGFEADDIIGTFSKRFEQEGFKVTIISGDKDLMQLVSKDVLMLDTLKDKTFTEKEVAERFGVPPSQVVEVMGLCGDTSDNIPGVPGVGEKTAVSLIQEFGTIDGVFNSIETIPKKALKQKLIDGREKAFLSRRLCTIVTDMDIDVDIESIKVKALDNEKIITLFRELEFSSLLKDFTIKKSADNTEKKYHIILKKEDLERVISEIKEAKAFALDTETTDPEPMNASLVGISLSYKTGEAYYIPVGHDGEGAPKQLDKGYVASVMAEVLKDPAIKKYGHNIKYDMIVLAEDMGIEIAGVSFDTMVGSYILNPSKRSHSLDATALEYLNYRKTLYKEVCGEGKNEVRFNNVDIAKGGAYSCEDADTTFRLAEILRNELLSKGMYELFNHIDMPLVTVLSFMERSGVAIDYSLLRDMGAVLEGDLNRLSSEIFKEAGEDFNINSPKQLAHILFEKLKLKTAKKTKTGYSTDTEVLEKLAETHPLPVLLLEYRQGSKLKSTYTDALPRLINKKTGRIHTSFNQTVTATGRLSSSDPNLQNIPIRTDMGRGIRKGFIANRFYNILSADYSQIELRILAHMADDEHLINSFLNGEDIHRRTAAEITGVSLDMVTDAMRRIAKSVNFGIVYGISAYGLSRDLGISRAEAEAYIDGYFAKYHKVAAFIKNTVDEAYKNGFVETMFKRRRYLPELTNSSKQIKEFAERAAVNTVIQGTAADIIKIAMARISKKIREDKLLSRMIIQVHDELVFEVHESEVNLMKGMIKEFMEGVVKLSVPVVVDMGVGKNWGEAH